MKILAILMVKNESRILERCIRSLQSVSDRVFVQDTGSTDDTVHIANQHADCVTTYPWKNFGLNRSRSFVDARKYVQELGWDLKETYGLLVDADMEFVAGTFRDQTLTEIGYTIVQVAGNLEYPNCRLVRMDYEWTCKGVTHEYWDGPTTALSKDICWIRDRNDGGCKSDKFQRDARLLEEGLAGEPNNVRYMFYLAQTYHSLGRWKDSVRMYKERIRAGGWFEEIWYSHYMIGQCYLSLQDPVRFEGWMLRAYKYRSQRAEPLYKLTKYFREQAQHYKAYHYAQLGASIPYPSDTLFVEKDVYTGLFDYEMSILAYYIHSPSGLERSMSYLLKQGDHAQTVLSNLKFYVQPLSSTRKALRFESPFGPDFHASAVSIDNQSPECANVRFVNYWIEGGDYKTLNNVPVQTHNAYMKWETGELLQRMKDESVELPRRNVQVRGLEDIRMCDGKCTATVQEYSDSVRVLEGEYDRASGQYKHCKILESPNQRHCEKNWLAIPSTNDMIYDWFPFQVIGDTQAVYNVPPIFKLLRGSAPAFRKNDEWWVLTHMVEYSKPRVYLHCFVVLDANYKPRRISFPFVFQSPSIEYCVSCTEDKLFVSLMDKDPHVVFYSEEDLHWMSI